MTSSYLTIEVLRGPGGLDASVRTKEVVGRLEKKMKISFRLIALLQYLLICKAHISKIVFKTRRFTKYFRCALNILLVCTIAHRNCILL